MKFKIFKTWITFFGDFVKNIKAILMLSIFSELLLIIILLIIIIIKTFEKNIKSKN